VDLLTDFTGQAILSQCKTAVETLYGSHDLLHEYVVEQMGAAGVREAHEKLLSGYRKRGNGAWASIPDDGRRARCSD
jgi:hypothetical protein